MMNSVTPRFDELRCRYLGIGDGDGDGDGRMREQELEVCARKQKGSRERRGQKKQKKQRQDRKKRSDGEGSSSEDEMKQLFETINRVEKKINRQTQELSSEMLLLNHSSAEAQTAFPRKQYLHDSRGSYDVYPRSLPTSHPYAKTTETDKENNPHQGKVPDRTFNPAKKFMPKKRENIMSEIRGLMRVMKQEDLEEHSDCQDVSGTGLRSRSRFRQHALCVGEESLSAHAGSSRDIRSVRFDEEQDDHQDQKPSQTGSSCCTRKKQGTSFEEEMLLALKELSIVVSNTQQVKATTRSDKIAINCARKMSNPIEQGIQTDRTEQLEIEQKTKTALYEKAAQIATLETRIQHLEEQNSQKHDELRESKEALRRVQRDLELKETEARKFEGSNDKLKRAVLKAEKLKKLLKNRSEKCKELTEEKKTVYKELKATVEASENAALETHVLCERNRAMEVALAQTKEELLAAEARKLKMECDLDERRVKYEEDRVKMRELRKLCDKQLREGRQLKNERKALRDQLSSEAADQESLRQQLEVALVERKKLDAEVTIMKQSSSELGLELRSVKAAHLTLKAEGEEKLADLIQLAKIAKALKEERNTYSQKVETFQSETLKRTVENEQLKLTIQSLESRCMPYRSEITPLLDDVRHFDDMKEKLGRLESENSSMKLDFERLKLSLQQAKDSTSESKKRESDLQSNLRIKAAMLSDQNDTIRKLKDRIVVLEKEAKTEDQQLYLKLQIAQKANREAMDAIDEQDRAIDKYETKLAKLERRHDAKKQELETVLKETEELRAKHKEVTENSLGLREREETLKKLKREITKLRKREVKLSEDFQVLKSATTNNERLFREKERVAHQLQEELRKATQQERVLLDEHKKQKRLLSDLEKEKAEQAVYIQQQQHRIVQVESECRVLVQVLDQERVKSKEKIFKFQQLVQDMQ